MSILVDEEENVLLNKLKPSPIFIYQMICTSDMVNEPFVQFKTPVMQVGYKQYAMDG